MLKLIDVALAETAVLMPEPELRQIIADAERYERLFFGLLCVCLGKTTNSEIEDWIGQHYIELRAELSPELKQLYLKNIAFRKK